MSYLDGAKTVAQGALGAMTFGAYHQFTTNRIMELNNQYMDLKHKHDIDNLNNKHKHDIDTLTQKHQTEMKQLHDELNLLKYSIEKNKSWWRRA